VGTSGKATSVAFAAGSPVVHVELFDAYPPPVITLRVLGVATWIVEDFQIRADLLMGVVPPGQMSSCSMSRLMKAKSVSRYYTQ